MRLEDGDKSLMGAIEDMQLKRNQVIVVFSAPNFHFGGIFLLEIIFSLLSFVLNLENF